MLNKKIRIQKRPIEVPSKRSGSTHDDHEITNLGSMDHIDWGWSSHEDRQFQRKVFRLWDGIIAGAVTLQYSLICFLAGLNPYDYVLLGISYLIDFLLVIDICLTVHRLYESDLHEVVLTKQTSKLNAYLTRHFILDVLSILPVDVGALVFVKEAKRAVFPSILGFCRTNRLISVYKVFTYLNNLESEIGANFTALRGTYYTVMCWMMLHGTACIWYAIPCEKWSSKRPGVSSCTAPSWIISIDERVPDNTTNAAEKPNNKVYATFYDTGMGQETDKYGTWRGRVNATVAQRYYYAMHWTVTTALSVGLGDVHGITTMEMLFIVLVELEGMIGLFGIIQGGITSMLSNFDSIMFRYKHRIAAILHYLRDQNQSTEIVRQVTDFYNYLWRRNRGASNDGILDPLPYSLRSEIAMELNGAIIDRSPLFYDLRASFLRMLCLRFQSVLALPGEIIMKRGEVSNMMVYIQKGELEVLSDDEAEVPVLLLKSGKLFGEINLITRLPRKNTVRAVAHCDLVILRTEDLMDCLQANPDIGDELRQRAEERTGLASQTSDGGLLAQEARHEVIRFKQQKELTEKIDKLRDQMGTVLRPLMTALDIPKPQDTLKLSESMDLYRIIDPMQEMVLCNMGSRRQQLRARLNLWLIPLKNFSIDPDGLFYRLWEPFILTLTVAAFFLNSYVGCFEDYGVLLGDPPGSANSGIFLLVFGYIMDILFVVDYAFKFVTQVVTANGKLTSSRDMCMNYVKSYECYVNFIGVFPLEVIVAFGMDAATSELAYLRMNRCLLICNLPRFFDLLSSDLNTSISVCRVIKFAVYLAIMSHVGAMLLYGVSLEFSKCFEAPKPSWICYAPSAVTGSSGNYSTALYFAVTLTTTVGFGDLVPSNISEQVIVNLVMFMGVLLYCYALCVLTATIANLDAPRVEFQDRLFSMISFMEYNKLSAPVQRRVSETIALLWTISSGEEIPGVQSMTADMPSHLMEDIQVDDLTHLVASVPIFKNIEEDLLRSFAPAVRRYFFPPEEFVVQRGDLIDELFIIRRGYCAMYHPDHPQKCIGVLQPGMFFGEIGFLFNRNEVMSVKTITHCEVVAFPRHEFNEVASTVAWLSAQMDRITHNHKYFADLVHAAKHAKPIHRHKHHDELTALDAHTQEKMKRRELFEELRALGLPKWKFALYRCLMTHTIPMDGKFLLYWEYVRIGLAALTFCMALIQVAFQITTPAYFGVVYLLDLYAFTDIYIKMHVQYSNGINIVVSHPYMTAKRYLSSNFLIDLIGVFPFELLLFLTVPDARVFDSVDEVLHWFVYIRLNRLLQVYRLPLAFDHLEGDIKVDTSSLFTIKALLYFVLFTVLVTCLPYTIECPPLSCGVTASGCRHNQTNDSRSDWDFALDIVDLDEFRLKERFKRDASPSKGALVDDDNSTSCYTTGYTSIVMNMTIDTTLDLLVTSMYWAITTTTTTGYGDIYALNETEQIVFLCIMIAGNIFFGYAVACMSAAATNSDAKRSRFFEKLTAIKQYMIKEKLPKRLIMRVVKYYEYIWLRTQGTDPRSLIAGLPPSLSGELSLQLYKKVIDQIPIFKNTPSGFKKMLASVVRPLYVMEGEYITRAGDVGSDLFFLYRGNIEVIYRNGEASASVIRAGRILGELAFLTNQVAKTSYRAKENSDLYCLAKSDFDMVLDHFPEIRHRLVEETQGSVERELRERQYLNAKPQLVESLAAPKSLAYKPEPQISMKERWQMITTHIFRPDSKVARYVSRYLINVLRAASVVLILYQPAFNVYNTSLLVANYVLEACFILNVGLQLRMGFLDEYGNQILDSARIRRRYVSKKLISDIFALFPYEIFYFTAPAPFRAQLWGYLRLFRVIPRFLRIQKFFQDWLCELDINVLVVRLMYSLTQLGLWMHFFTCLAYYIAVPNGVIKLNEWIATTSLKNDKSNTVNYITSLYWVCTTVTSVGYGEIAGTTALSRVFSCVVQLAGKTLFGFIIGDISSALANAELSRQNFESQYQAIKTYLTDQQATKSIIDRVQNYFNYIWTTNRGVTDINVVLQDAPYCLRTEILFEVHHKDLRQLLLFRDASDAFLRMLSSCLHQMQFVPGDYIIQQGDLVHEVYFLHAGEAVEIENGVEVLVIKNGSHVNWQAVLIDWPASRTVRATDNCEVYVLTREDLDSVVSCFASEMEQICRTTRTRLKDLLEEEHAEID